MHDEKMDKYMKGTTTVGLVCRDAVILAADHRATMGTLIADKEAKKIWEIADHMALTTAGVVGDNQALVRLMKAEAALYELQSRKMPVDAAATLLSNILNQQRYFPLYIQMILGGYDTEGRVYEVDMVGGVTPKKYSATGSGSPVSYGVLEALFKENMSVDEAKEVVTKAMKAAIERDSAVGNGFDILTITKKGITRELVK